MREIVNVIWFLRAANNTYFTIKTMLLESQVFCENPSRFSQISAEFFAYYVFSWRQGLCEVTLGVWYWFYGRNFFNLLYKSKIFVRTSNKYRRNFQCYFCLDSYRSDGLGSKCCIIFANIGGVFCLVCFSVTPGVVWSHLGGVVLILWRKFFLICGRNERDCKCNMIS